MLAHVLDQALRLLHPHMPFVTEAAWRALSPHLAEAGAEALIVAPFPQADDRWLDAESEAKAEAVIDVIRAIRNIRAERGVEPARFVEAYAIGDGAVRQALEASREAIVAMSRAKPLHIVAAAGEAPSEGVVTAVLRDAQVVLPMAGLFDVEAERQRLSKQLAASEAEVERLQSRLADEQFRRQGAGSRRRARAGEAGGGAIAVGGPAPAAGGAGLARHVARHPVSSRGSTASSSMRTPLGRDVGSKPFSSKSGSDTVSG